MVWGIAADTLERLRALQRVDPDNPHGGARLVAVESALLALGDYVLHHP